MNWKHLLLGVLCLSSIVAADVTESADQLFARAAGMAASDLTKSRELQRLAALHYQAEAEARPDQRGPLLYNAGNAFFLAGDAGRAIVAYRRAASEMPGSALLRANLAFVRKQCGNPDEAPPVWWLGVLRFWSWQPPVLWLALTGAALVFWTGVFCHQWTGRRWPRGVTYGALSFALLMGVTLALRQFGDLGRCRGVLVTAQVVARKGPNYGYAPAFNQPLEAGLECEVTRRDGEWLCLALPENRVAWVPLDTVEIWQGNPPR